jgi:hypothetical protein
MNIVRSPEKEEVGKGKRWPKVERADERSTVEQSQ